MRGNSLFPALIGSLVLHAVLFGFALWKWPTQTREVLNAIPVQIVSDMPAMAPAPAAPPTMDEAPEPEPVEEAPPEPTPPTPEPPKPVPPKPEPKPTPTPKPEKKPTPKPTPQKEAALDLDALADSLKPQKKKPRTSRAETPTKGTSNSGAAQADMGPAINALSAKLMRLWNPNCGVEGADQVMVTVGFTLSDGGRVIKGPIWVNKRGDAVSQAAATRAVSAVKRGEPYLDLPDGLYNEAIEVDFNGREACR